MKRTLIASVLALSAAVVTAAAPTASEWEIGPIIRGKNYSVGMPLAPKPERDGWSFDFPVGSKAAGHVHYVTFRPGSLVGKSRIVVRYRIDAKPGTRFVPQANPDRVGTVSLYLQRRGDSWNAKGRYQYYRWYAPSATVRELAPGVGEISVALDDPQWISVLGQPSANNPGAMQDALADIERIGLVFGSSNARGHGVYATAPSTFVMTGFRVD
ncbi:hypothetical protein EEB18_009135 [Sphingopyxis sp. OPL5]|uniref:hypothetical protein n=1 Tax=Sphingopyxis sp. OPL5 TaxID=2486273 RepID=UPI00164EB9DA|nr:hypothetical protein [Sphingopyxis sp. OPL5]QNO29074.1 hypothetical protein EEB18_009135 [Sphingopyxis sp. OPL5]